MTVANQHTQRYDNGRDLFQSLLFNNPHRVIKYLVRNETGDLVDRADQNAPVRRLYETEASAEHSCLQTIQFVHHMLIPSGGRHVHELHIHPDSEELVVVTEGSGLATVAGEQHQVQAGDVIYIPPSAEHAVTNTGDVPLGVLFINVPTGPGLENLGQAQ
jgi:mannose-6-phosphate isomerase-like protein (cupin superfamily)